MEKNWSIRILRGEIYKRNQTTSFELESKINVRECRKREDNINLSENFIQSPCIKLDEKEIHFICSWCRTLTNSSLCGEEYEMMYHNMYKHHIYPQESVLRNGLCVRTYNYLLAMNTSNPDVKKYSKVDENTKEGKRFLNGDAKATAFYVKKLLIDGSCRKSDVISKIIREKPMLFKRFLECIKENDHSSIEDIWKNDEAGRALVESNITIPVRNTVDMDEEESDGGKIGTYEMKLFQSGLKTKIFKYLTQEEMKYVVKRNGFVSDDGSTIFQGFNLEVLRRHCYAELAKTN